MAITREMIGHWIHNLDIHSSRGPIGPFELCEVTVRRFAVSKPSEITLPCYCISARPALEGLSVGSSAFLLGIDEFVSFLYVCA